MRKRFLLLFMLLGSLGILYGQRCRSVQSLQAMMASNPVIKQRRQKLEDSISKMMENKKDRVQPRMVVSLPVVVHIVWKDPKDNISEEQINSQIDALNENFGRQDVNLNQVPLEFQDLIADLEIQFCLAKTDPEGKATTGITRTETDVNFIGTDISQGNRTICYSDLGGQDAWDPEHYINIWVGRFNFGLLGDASFPEQDTITEDGLRIDPNYFGRVGLAENSFPYNLGKTTTHEMGHFFDLFHPWGELDQLVCDDDDGIADTPATNTTYIEECPEHPVMTCGTNDMFMNYMYYTNDACMSMFTKGQKLKVWAILNGPRAKLLESNGCEVVSTKEVDVGRNKVQIMGNPIRKNLHLQSVDFIPKNIQVELVNLSGQSIIQVKWSNSSDFFMDIGAYAAGTYFVIVHHPNWIFAERIVLLK